MDNQTVVNILSENGPGLSSAVGKVLQETYNLAPAAARKRIERAKAAGSIKTFANLNLKHGDQFLYLETQKNDPGFLKLFANALKSARSDQGKALMGVEARGSIVPKHLFAAFSGLPIIAKDQKQRVAEQVFKELEGWGLLSLEQTKAGPCIVCSEQLVRTRTSDGRVIGRLIAEDMLLATIHDWLRIQGFITADKFSIRNGPTLPQFGFYQWDLVAPSYLAALRSGSVHSDLTPGYVVADVILGRMLTTDDVAYFIEKSNAIKLRGAHRPFIAFLVADRFKKEALVLGRKHGLVFTTVKNLFGKQVYEALDQIVQVIENRKSAADCLSSFAELISTIGHLSTALHSIKERLLVVLISALISDEQPSSVDYSRVFRLTSDETVAVDLLVRVDQKIYVVQCINDIHQLSPRYFYEWFSKQVPGIYSILCRQTINAEIRHYSFELFCSDKIPAEFIEKLTALRNPDLPYTIKCRDRTDLDSMMANAPSPVRQLYTLAFGEGQKKVDFRKLANDDDDPK